jgi:hypothetical protein
MAVTVITDENEKSPEQPRTESDNGKQIELGMAAEFGAMKESNRQLQAQLSEAQMNYQRAVETGEATQRQLAALQTRIDQLEADLLAEEEQPEEKTMVTPPPAEQPKQQEKPVSKRSILQTILYGK